jgi:hypothetical protein
MVESRVEGLKRELAAAIRANDHAAQKAVRTELAKLVDKRETAIKGPGETA